MPSSNSTLSGLLIQQTQAQIYAAALQEAANLGLVTTSWQPGDPTRSLFFIESQFIETLEQIVVGFIQSGFLDYAALPVNDANGNPLPQSNAWLNVIAQEVYNVIVPPATYATTTETLTNTGGGLYVINPGDLTFSNPTNGATYTNTQGCTLTAVGTPGATQSVTITANIVGSAGSASAGQINTLVTPLLGVTCTNPTAATGLDQQPAATTIQQCRNKLASLSPNGPAGAYAFVALNSALTGITTPTAAKVFGDSTTGNVTVYVCGAGGAALSPSDVAAVQSAIQTWATPLCITPTVVSATPVPVAVTYTVYLYSSVNQTSAQIQAAILTELTNLFAARPIGGDNNNGSSGFLYASMIEAAIGSVFPNQTFRVVLTLPIDSLLFNWQVATLGTVTGTVQLVPGP